MPDARAWLEVFRKATPTFKAHCLEDPCVPEAEREVPTAGSAEGDTSGGSSPLPRFLNPAHKAPCF